MSIENFLPQLLIKNELTRNEFIKWYEKRKNSFNEYESKSFKDVYRIEYNFSFIKCAIQRTKNGVQIIYLNSDYNDILHKKILIAYCTFIIAYRLNKNKMFESVTFNGI